VPGVERAHRRHEADGAARPGRQGSAQVVDRGYDAHIMSIP